MERKAGVMNHFLTGILPQEGGLDFTASWKYTTAVMLCGLLTLIGVAFGIHSIIAGHEHTFGVTRDVPWGVLIAAYVFFVVTSTGLCIVSSIGHVFGFKDFNPIAKRAVFLSIATIVAGFLVIAFEIENSWRMPVGNVLGANPTSNIWWMGTPMYKRSVSDTRLHSGRMMATTTATRHPRVNSSTRITRATPMPRFCATPARRSRV